MTEYTRDITKRTAINTNPRADAISYIGPSSGSEGRQSGSEERRGGGHQAEPPGDVYALPPLVCVLVL